MKLRRLLFVAAFLLMSCVSMSSNWNHKHVTEITENILTVDMTFDYRFPSRSDKFKGEMVGAVTYIGDGYFVGAAHCFDNTNIMVPSGLYYPIVSDNIKYTIGIVPLKLIGSEGDIILFRANFGTKKKSIIPYDSDLPIYKWYDSDKLKTLDEVLLVGTPYMTEPNTRIGIVSDADITKETTVLITEEFKNLFNISIDTAPGDSGRAVFVNEDGELKIAGLLFAGRGGVLSCVWKSNYILEVIERLKEK